MAKASTNYSVGDLMWAKIGSYPYWPCIVSTSPGTQTFQKPAKKGSLVHVHFFGDNGKHSWVSSSSLMVFKGTEEFNKLKFKSGDSTKPQPGFNVKSNLKSAWNHAVAEIETVLNKDNATRIDAYYDLYPLKMPMSNKRKSVSSEEEEVPAKIPKSTPPKKAIKAAHVESLQNGDVKEEDSKVEPKEVPVSAVKSKKPKSTPPKKAIKASHVESLQNGDVKEEDSKVEPKEVPVLAVKSKKESKNKKTAAACEPKKPEVVESTPAAPVAVVQDPVDLKPALRKIQESLQSIVTDKRQLSLARSLIEKVVKLAVNNELTDETELE